MAAQTKTCWMFIGTCGGGKSTMVNQLTNSEVATSNGADSCTYEVAMYQSTLDGVCLLDTVGAEDTSGLSNSDILGKICDKLGPNGCHDVKIVWVVKPNNKKTPELQTQARFIGALARGTIWNSVIIVVKKGITKDDAQGARASAKMHGCNCEIPTFNLHILDLIDNHQSIFMYKIVANADFGVRSEGGFLHKNEIKRWLDKHLETRKTSSVAWTKEYYHSGTQDKSMYHPGLYKMGGWNKTGFWTLGILTLGIGNGLAAIGDGHEACRQWRCCGKTSRDAAACTVKERWWTCCGKSIGSQGCKSRYVPQ